MVLTGEPDSSAHEKLLNITGLPLARFESLYWADRPAYDEGKLTGIGYWQKFLREAGLPADQKKVEDSADDSLRETWYYLKDGHRWVVRFLNGKVAKVQVF